MSVVLLLVAATLGWVRWRPAAVRPRPARADPPPAGLDVVLLLALLEVAIGAGAALPRALQVVGRAGGGTSGEELAVAAGRLVLGATWEQAWPRRDGPAAPVADGLASAWTAGAAPGPQLRLAADRARAGRRDRARMAAGVLGARLVLPLGLCLLPSFVLLGLVPAVTSLAGGLLGRST